MESTLTSNPVMEKFLESFKAFETPLSQSAPQVVLRAHESLASMNFPTTRNEEWKYTRTARISNESWNINAGQSIANIDGWRIPNLDAHVLVFVNGFFSAELSDKTEVSGVRITHTLEESTCSLRNESLFNSLNAAYNTASLRIDVEKNAIVSKPIHILHITTGSQSLAQVRFAIQAEQSSSCHIVESYVSTSEEKSFSNRILNVHVEENAELKYYKLQLENDAQFLINEDLIAVDGNARFTIHTLSIDGGWIRNALNISLDGKNIEANLNGLYLPRRRQFVDNHTKVDHRFPHCNSNELYKGILFDSSTGVFNGKVYVRPDAQKTNAYQSNANILMSDDAQMNSKPELEIYADDVKCSHGSTSGQMDEQALFYLKSRGLSDTNARKLLSTAFIQAVLDKIELEPIRNYAVSELIKRDLLFA
ncbi:MAG: Fe-S cluster assembly protein SufD [Flavobacteriales bacterium]